MVILVLWVVFGDDRLESIRVVLFAEMSQLVNHDRVNNRGWGHHQPPVERERSRR